jgi:hypothetical protein
MSAAFDYMDVEDARDIRAALSADTGLETLGTHAEELGPDAADIDPLEMFVEVADEEPCGCGGQGLGLDGFHYTGAIGCRRGGEGAARGPGLTRKEPSSPPSSDRSPAAARLDRLFAALYPLIDEASKAGHIGAAGILRSTIFALTLGRETLAKSAGTLRTLEISWCLTATALKLRADDEFFKVADIYGRAAAVIEAFR